MPQHRSHRRDSPTPLTSKTPKAPKAVRSSKLIQTGHYQIRHLNQRQSSRVKQRQSEQYSRVYQSKPPRKRESLILTDNFHRNSSHDDDSLHATRMKYLRESAPVRQPGIRSVVVPPQVLKNFPNFFANSKRPSANKLRNFANSGAQKGQRTVLTYSQSSESPTNDLQSLVLVLVREQLRKEVAHLNDVTNDTNPFEMTNMRLKSFIANTHDIMDYWKCAMLTEGMRIIDESLEAGEMAWVVPGANHQLSMMVDEEMLGSVPPDKPEISKSQVASEYIQAQRGRQGNEQEDSVQLFQSEMLQSEVAAKTSPEMFDRIVNCHKHVVQKVVEIEFIEKKPETVGAVANYINQLKYSVDRVVQDAMTQDLVEAVEQGRTFVRVLVGQIMDELHESHRKREFEPMRVLICATNPD